MQKKKKILIGFLYLSGEGSIVRYNPHHHYYDVKKNLETFGGGEGAGRGDIDINIRRHQM